MKLPWVAAPGWWVGARCRKERIPVSFFFSKEDIPEARRVCKECPVRYRCLTEHLEEPFGVWGGHSKDERSRVLSLMDQGATLVDASRRIDARRNA